MGREIKSVFKWLIKINKNKNEEIVIENTVEDQKYHKICAYWNRETHGVSE